MRKAFRSCFSGTTLLYQPEGDLDFISTPSQNSWSVKNIV